MSEIVDRKWTATMCSSDWEPHGETIVVTSSWSGSTHRTIAMDAADEATACHFLDDMDGRVIRLLVTDDAGVSERVRVESTVNVTFEATVEPEQTATVPAPDVTEGQP